VTEISQDELKAGLAFRFSGLSKHKAELDRAIEVVINGCVKQHVFIPSRKTLYTVVGRSGEEFIDPGRPYCSCKQFFFRVLGGKAETCYHLLSYEIAKEAELFDETTFRDEEFGAFLRLLTIDLLKDKEDKES